jgi:hypothetical protein
MALSDGHPIHGRQGRSDIFESFDEEDDYYTHTAAEQAALHYGRFAVDLIYGMA